MSEIEDLRANLAIAVKFGRLAQDLCQRQHALLESFVHDAMPGRENRKRRENLLAAILAAARTITAEPLPEFEWPTIEVAPGGN